MNLDQLCDIIERRFGQDGVIAKTHYGNGHYGFECKVNDVVKAEWKSKLVNPPVYDGQTPRGPSEYYDLKFIP